MIESLIQNTKQVVLDEVNSLLKNYAKSSKQVVLDEVNSLLKNYAKSSHNHGWDIIVKDKASSGITGTITLVVKSEGIKRVLKHEWDSIKIFDLK